MLDYRTTPLGVSAGTVDAPNVMRTSDTVRPPAGKSPRRWRTTETQPRKRKARKARGVGRPKSHELVYSCASGNGCPRWVSREGLHCTPCATAIETRDNARPTAIVAVSRHQVTDWS